MKLEYIVTKNCIYKTMNDVLFLEFNLSTRLFGKLIKNEKIFLNDKFCDTRTKLNENDKICIDFSLEEDNSNVAPNKMDLDIVYEDEWFLILNKSSRNCYSSFKYSLL